MQELERHLERLRNLPAEPAIVPVSRMAVLPPPDLAALFDTVPEARRWPITADSARPETISYLQRHGFPNIRPEVKGTGSVEDGVEFLKSHDILVHPRCRHLADELALYSYRIDPDTGERLRRLEDRENHVIDALRYAVEGRQRGSYDGSPRWVG